MDEVNAEGQENQDRIEPPTPFSNFEVTTPISISNRPEQFSPTEIVMTKRAHAIFFEYQFMFYEKLSTIGRSTSI